MYFKLKVQCNAYLRYKNTLKYWHKLHISQLVHQRAKLRGLLWCAVTKFVKWWQNTFLWFMPQTITYLCKPPFKMRLPVKGAPPVCYIHHCQSSPQRQCHTRLHGSDNLVLSIQMYKPNKNLTTLFTRNLQPRHKTLSTIKQFINTAKSLLFLRR